ncbi:hypothetical protein CJ20_174 [Escherichia phage CJ20]|nr:hypothetical protein CJ20_174 [Escherichia phage CJ20]
MTSIFVIGAPRRRRIASFNCFGLYDSVAICFPLYCIYTKKGPKPFCLWSNSHECRQKNPCIINKHVRESVSRRSDRRPFGELCF